MLRRVPVEERAVLCSKGQELFERLRDLYGRRRGRNELDGFDLQAAAAFADGDELM